MILSRTNFLSLIVLYTSHPWIVFYLYLFLFLSDNHICSSNVYYFDKSSKNYRIIGFGLCFYYIFFIGLYYDLYCSISLDGYLLLQNYLINKIYYITIEKAFVIKNYMYLELQSLKLSFGEGECGRMNVTLKLALLTHHFLSNYALIFIIL